VDTQFVIAALKTFTAGFVLAMLVSIQLRMLVVKGSNILFFAISFFLNAFWGVAVHMIAKDSIMIIIYATATATAMTIGKNLPIERIDDWFRRVMKLDR